MLKASDVQQETVESIAPKSASRFRSLQRITDVRREMVSRGFKLLYRSVFDLVRRLLEPKMPAAKAPSINRYLEPDLLIIHDMGLKILPSQRCAVLLEIIMRGYENRSTLITANRPVEEWEKLQCDLPTASAILDRLPHYSEIIAIIGHSYRLKVEHPNKTKATQTRPRRKKVRLRCPKRSGPVDSKVNDTGEGPGRWDR